MSDQNSPESGSGSESVRSPSNNGNPDSGSPESVHSPSNNGSPDIGSPESGSPDNGSPDSGSAEITKYVMPSLMDASLEQLRDALDTGHTTCVKLVETYQKRISEVNSVLNPVTEVDPDALAIAAERDAERLAAIAAGRLSSLSPLHGLPILLKNNIGTNDRTNTTAGSTALVGARLPEDSTVVAKLRAAGAIMLGKANMSQWASCRALGLLEAWSADGGQTRGAYMDNMNPKGSSSGSAVATSVGLTWASLATDTGGSISLPAQQNNVVGVRPTTGLTSRSLVIPYSYRIDSVGTMTTSVKDAAYLLSAIAGQDAKDPRTSDIPFTTMPDYVAACKPEGLRGKKIAVSRNLMRLANPFNFDLPVEAFNAALNIMAEAGARIYDDFDIAGPGEAFAMEKLLAPYPPCATVDFSVDLANEYLSRLTENPNNIHSLEDLREYTQQTPAEGYPALPTDIWDTVLNRGTSPDSPQYKSRVSNHTMFFGARGIITPMVTWELDAFVMWAAEASMFSTYLGLPVFTVPLGCLGDNAPQLTNIRGLVDSGPNKPFGISFVGLEFSEEKLFEIAYAFEQLTKARSTVKPVHYPKAELTDLLA